jgi:hypothetical protein
MLMYRSTEGEVPIFKDDKARRSYFQTAQPAEWIGKDEAEDWFMAIYGADALRYVRSTGLVPENYSPVWVGGTYWDDPKRRTRPVYQTPEKAILGASPGEAFGKVPTAGRLLDVDLSAIRDIVRQVIREELAITN